MCFLCAREVSIVGGDPSFGFEVTPRHGLLFCYLSEPTKKGSERITLGKKKVHWESFFSIVTLRNIYFADAYHMIPPYGFTLYVHRLVCAGRSAMNKFKLIDQVQVEDTNV